MNANTNGHFRNKAFVKIFLAGILPIVTVVFLILNGNVFSRNEMLVFSGLAFLAVALLSVMFADSLAKPVRALADGASAAAQGDFSAPIDIKTGDEVQVASESVNKLAAGAKELQSLKDEVIFIAAHELKAPILLQQKRLSGVSQVPAAEVMADNTRLLKLAEEMLQVARFESQGVEVALVPVDFPAAVQYAIAELKPLADTKGIYIKYASSDMPKVMADEARLREIMVNLIGNAIKYTPASPSGGPSAGTIDISHEISGDRVITTVKDTGLGIPPEAQDKIFQKFYRVQDARVPEDHGAGLGLYITKYLIEKMNGSISAQSVYGAGTTISFSLPDIVLKKQQ